LNSRHRLNGAGCGDGDFYIAALDAACDIVARLCPLSEIENGEGGNRRDDKKERYWRTSFFDNRYDLPGFLSHSILTAQTTIYLSLKGQDNYVTDHRRHTPVSGYSDYP
jgi:hypothetical protein